VGCSQPGEAERLSLVDRVTIDRKRCSEPDTAVVPRRLRIPLTLGEVDPMRRGQQRSRELQARSSLDFLGERTTDVVGDVDLAALSIVSRVLSSGTLRNPRRLTAGALRQ